VVIVLPLYHVFFDGFRVSFWGYIQRGNESWDLRARGEGTGRGELWRESYGSTRLCVLFRESYEDGQACVCAVAWFCCFRSCSGYLSLTVELLLLYIHRRIALIFPTADLLLPSLHRRHQHLLNSLLPVTRSLAQHEHLHGHGYGIGGSVSISHDVSHLANIFVVSVSWECWTLDARS
jgi:hypothetical protein